MARRFTGLGVAVEGTQAAKTAAPRPVEYLALNAAGDGAAEIVVLVGDLNGRVIGELDANLEGVAWKLSDYGQARMTLARGSATATTALLRPGNRVLIQFGNGLPDWGGMIDLPRRWRDGRIEVTAYSGERILVDRITDRGRYFSNVTAGEIFRSLLTEAVPAGVEVGQVLLGGDLHGPDYHLRGLHDIFTKGLSRRIEEADWNVESRLVGGRIVMRANFFERRGIDHGKRLGLIEGVNLADGTMDEQGPLVNEWQLAGAGSGWSESNRLYASASDETSQARYGLRQRGEVRADVTTQGTLDAYAAARLAESREPRGVVSPMALDQPPARWHQYDIGDTVWMELYEAGFGGYARPVRVRAREYLVRRGVCSLVVE